MSGLAAWALALAAGPVAAQSRSVVLFVQEGATAAHVDAARADRGGTLLWEEFPVSSGVERVPASVPAAATALACGVDSSSESLGLDASGASVLTLLESAQSAGWATGLITNVSPTRAVPAAFRSHVADAALRDEIIWGIYSPPLLDVVFAGGMETGEMADFDALGIAMATGFRPVWFPEDLADVRPGIPHYAIFDFNQDDRLSPPGPPLSVLSEQPQLETRGDGTHSDPHLSQLVEAAFAVTSINSSGCLLVVAVSAVEGSESADLLEMDRAVQAAGERLAEGGQAEDALQVVVLLSPGGDSAAWSRGPGSERLANRCTLVYIHEMILMAVAGAQEDAE